jgi:3-isopropylmalate dehydrogenase
MESQPHAARGSSTSSPRFAIAILAGDGIGPSVVAQALKVLDEVSASGRAHFELRRGLIGAAALAATGEGLPVETVELCRSSDAVLLGAVGHPDWDMRDDIADRPALALLRLRRELGLYANLRPVTLAPSIRSLSWLNDRGTKDGVDLLIVRDMSAGLFFGVPRGRRQSEMWKEQEAYDTTTYRPSQVARIGRVAFELAQRRRMRLTSVDQANVLATGRLWREEMTRLATDYPDVALDHLYVDNCANALVREPASFDVIVTDGLFGGILSDEAGAIAGSIGMLPSASVGEGTLGLFEPVHGSAPKHAGHDRVNPIGTIRSLALLLSTGLGLHREGELIEEAILVVLERGLRTYDIATEGEMPVGTEALGDAIAAETSRLLRRLDR